MTLKSPSSPFLSTEILTNVSFCHGNLHLEQIKRTNSAHNQSVKAAEQDKSLPDQSSERSLAAYFAQATTKKYSSRNGILVVRVNFLNCCLIPFFDIRRGTLIPNQLCDHYHHTSTTCCISCVKRIIATFSAFHIENR